MNVVSTKPYLLRAIFEWCLDQGYTPYINVSVDESTRVPREHVKSGQIVLNLDPEATHQLTIGNESITFSARFNGVAQALAIPVARVSAIYARENGEGMAFEVAVAPAAEFVSTVDIQAPSDGADESPDPGVPEVPSVAGRAHLTRIK